MSITPKFTVTQTEQLVSVRCVIPHCKLKTLEFNVDQNIFEFYLEPYYLRLKFSHPIKEEGPLNKHYFIEGEGLFLC